MGSKIKYYSHPDKELSRHILGVTNLSLKKAQSVTSEIGDFPFVEALRLSGLLHDIAKMNVNFQHFKLKKGKKPSGTNTYSNHALFGAYLSNNIIGHLVRKHPERFKEHFPILHQYKENNPADFSNLLRTIFHIIVAHHGNLRNITEISPNLQRYDDNGNPIHCEAMTLSEFLKESEAKFPYAEFFVTSLLKDISICVDDIKEVEFNSFINFLNAKENARISVEHFMFAQMMFGMLVESDKRDASYNKNSVTETKRNPKKFNKDMRKVMDKKLSSMPPKNPLNEVRGQIQDEAVSTLSRLLDTTDKRVFELTAPTGAGKTLTLRRCDLVIKEKRGMDLTTVYTLPFRAIIEQVESIMKRDNVAVSSFSSSSDLATALDDMVEHQKNWKYDREKPLDKLRKEMGFSLQVFDANFIITTFQQVFETMLANGNSKAMRLSNFRNKVFLIDEVQALPYEMQTFFSCWLQMFCSFFNSYAIIASATMPYLEANEKNPKDRAAAKHMSFSYDSPHDVFGKHAFAPPKLIDSDLYFGMDMFNRYNVYYNTTMGENLDEVLLEVLKNGGKQSLVVFNTIADSKKFYKKAKLEHPNVIALNGEMKPADKKKNIERIRECLASGEALLVSSTQCIEAGVDVDFPVVYRDYCPVTSLIQTAGRCNREGKMVQRGKVILFKLKNWKKGKGHHEYRYQHVYEWYDATKFMDDLFGSDKFIAKGYLEEKELYHDQKDFFYSKHKSKIMGFYRTHETDVNGHQKTNEHYLLEEVLRGNFRTVGSYRLLGSRDRQAIYYFGPDELIEKLKKFHAMSNDMLSGDDKFSIQSSISRQEVDNIRRKVINECITLRVEEKSEGLVNSIIKKADEFLGIMIPHPEYRDLYDPEYGLIDADDEEAFS